jgi:hypothetical protein
MSGSQNIVQRHPVAAKVAIALLGALVIVLAVYIYRHPVTRSGFVACGAPPPYDCNASCHTPPDKLRGDRCCEPLSCALRKCPRRLRAPDTPCREPPAAPLPVRDACQRPDKLRGESTCPPDLCRGWCWDPTAVEEAQGLASSGATGYESTDLGAGSLRAALDDA